jgi:hypothetical protein
MISVAPVVHWASSIVHWPREVLSEARRSGPAIPCKSGQKGNRSKTAEMFRSNEPKAPTGSLTFRWWKELVRRLPR